MIHDLLAVLAAEAHRHDASVKTEHAQGQWKASLVNGQRELLAVQDEYLEPALARLWAAVGGGRLDSEASGDHAPIELTPARDRVDRARDP